jgi:glycerol uptake facilitator-like aquaporin
MFVIAFVIASLIITVAGILIGLPVTHLLSSKGAESSASYLLAGMVSGGAVMLAALLVDHILGRALEPAELIDAFAAGAIPGAVCAGMWWFLYRKHAQSIGD